jgi:excisionase family DNA binding protein
VTTPPLLGNSPRSRHAPLVRPPADRRRFRTRDDLAAATGLSIRHLDRLLKAKRIRATKSGRRVLIHIDDFELALERLRKGEL